jgi:hypothetical protein
MTRPLLRVTPALGLAAILLACDRHLAERCAPPAFNPPVAVAPDSLRGEFELIMVAESGPRSGAAARGHLTLWRSDSTTQPKGATAMRQVLSGSTKLLPGGIGVKELPVPADSRNSEEPGVRVWSEGPDPSPLSMGIGQRSHGDGIALRILSHDSSGYRGVWIDSGREGHNVGGHFCVRPLP